MINRDDIIRMAREAGAIPIHGNPKDVALVGIENIERFAQLVAKKTASDEADLLTIAHMDGYSRGVNDGMKEEREACAQIAFSWNTPTTDQVAKEIRERGQK